MRSGRVAFLTGAANGLGREMLLELQRRGVRVVALDVDAETLGKLKGELAPGSMIVAGDVRDPVAMAEAVKRILSIYGRIDMLIVNAGIECVGTIWETDAETFSHVVSVNLLGAYNVISAALGPILSSRGHVLAMSSVAAFLPWPLAGSYGASKAGLEALIRALRFELQGTGVTFSTAYLGFVDTPMARRALGAPAVKDALAQLPLRLLGVMPLQDSATVARALIDGAEQRQTSIFLPAVARLTLLLRGLYSLFDSYFARSVGPIIQSERGFHETTRSRE
ncbi:MAG: SDR family NAD(P)-dependent oxidoreductase [Methylocystis sp.]|uniref:SDR family NAD(P)-dependent oxidoreductase n=1 Tax=Methylocystis sp. TaxID=1911079 RepID=UPI003DA1DE62